VIVALVDLDAGLVRAAFKGTVAEDPWMQVSQGSLRVDTAPYDLAPGVRAFGVDVTSTADRVSCVDAGLGAVRTLFVHEGQALRPVLGLFGVSAWAFTHGNPVCEPDTAAASRLETTWATIAIAPHATHGFADLVVTESIEGREPGRKLRGERYELHYDGTTYRRDGKLRPPPVIAPSEATRADQPRGGS